MKIYLLLFLLLFFFLAKPLLAQNYNVSEEESLKLARNMEASMANDDPSVLGNLFDLHLFIEKIKAGSVNTADTKVFFDGFESTFSMTSFGTQMLQNMKGGSYELIKSYSADNRRHLLFRAFGKAGLNYTDFSLVKVSDSIKADDAFSYISGEKMSVTMSDLINTMISKMGNDLDSLSDDLNFFLELKEHSQKQNYQGVIDLFENSGDKYKRNKGFQIIYITACHKINNSKYTKALEDFALLFPDSPNTYLLMLDLYYLTREYDKGIMAINKLDSLIGGDVFLNFFRANFFLAAEKNVEAKSCYEKFFNVKPTLTYIIKNLVTLYMEDNEKAKAKSAISVYLNSPGYKQEYIDYLYGKYPELK